MDEPQRPPTEEELAECQKHLDEWSEGFRDVPLTSESAHRAGIFQLNRKLGFSQPGRDIALLFIKTLYGAYAKEKGESNF